MDESRILKSRYIKQAEELYIKANRFVKDRKLQEAERIIKELSELGSKRAITEIMVYSMILEASVQFYLKSFDKGFIRYYEALSIAEKLRDMTLISLVNIELGKWYSEFNEHDKAITILLKVLDIDPENGNALNTIAIAYARKANFERAIFYFKKKYQLSKQQNLELDISISTSNMGLCFTSLHNYQDALNCFNEALSIEIKLQNENRICNIKNSIANVYIKLNDMRRALDFAINSYELSEKNQNMEEQERALNNLYIIYRELHFYDKAFESVDKSRELQNHRTQQIISERIKDMESLLNYERSVYSLKEKELQKNNEVFKYKYEHFQTAYTELLNMGEIGIFSDKIRNVLEIAYFFHQDRNISVLIEGETGTGKEIIARVVHFGKEGDIRPFVTINCSAISSSLFESELFGYEEGAFTGARVGGMIGKLELAQGGTLFLDEIGEMPIELQAKLLRVIQQKEFYRISGKESIKLDVRIICATNRDLKFEMENKRFRPDLFYRLTTGRIFIPPLRERIEEIAPLTHMFMQKFSEEKKKNFRYIDKSVLDFLEHYDWPGNIRELQNTIERIIILYDELMIKSYHLAFLNNNKNEPVNISSSSISFELPDEGIDLRDLQKLIMQKVLQRFDGNKTKTADYLKITRKTLYMNKIER